MKTSTKIGLLYALATKGASLPVLTLVRGTEHLTSGMATAALFTFHPPRTMAHRGIPEVSS